ncbi:TadE/TadG family type IV pilus assembly protein [Streptomyces bambusae]|uniref:TadE/TadG family type IV pilus assembly protein n=1 Tax=Streptomyces bambusae TaxID=1550616 RepID=UPI0021556658|nr:TadE/TadG family type IV pilus assembly protein [Streptomyces bambusae]
MPRFGKGRVGEQPRRATGPRPSLGLRPRPGIRPRDAGQVALEYIGFVPILLFVALCAIQLGVVAYAEEQADTAARTAARIQAREGKGGAAAGRAALSDWLAERARIDVPRQGDAVTATVEVTVPSVIPGLGSHTARRSATMPYDAPEGTR